jgi:hypothetical protein
MRLDLMGIGVEDLAWSRSIQERWVAVEALSSGAFSRSVLYLSRIRPSVVSENAPQRMVDLGLEGTERPLFPSFSISVRR